MAISRCTIPAADNRTRTISNVRPAILSHASLNFEKHLGLIVFTPFNIPLIRELNFLYYFK